MFLAGDRKKNTHCTRLSIALVKSIDPSAATSPHKEIKGRPGSLARPLTPQTVHLCVDMQRIFLPGRHRPTPWMPRVVPMISELAGRFPERSPAIAVNKPKDDNARRRGAKLHVA
jgi:hypothetical protein